MENKTFNDFLDEVAKKNLGVEYSRDVLHLVAAEAAELYANYRVEKLQAFKDYVHQRLDEAGVEKDPKGEHSEHGCRIGDRLDIVLNQHCVEKAGEWVSVDERLPEIGSRCLTIEADGTIEICRYRSSYYSYPIKNVVCFEDEQDEQPSQINATHWQPLPKPPQP